MTDLEKLAELIEETTAARGVDLFAIDNHGVPATEWAEMTGRDRSTVSRNVRRASREINPRCWQCGKDLEDEGYVETAGGDLECRECAGLAE